MNNRNKPQNLSFLKICSFFFLTICLLTSCEQKSNNASLNEKFIDIYKIEINTKLEELNYVTNINPAKYKKGNSEIIEIQSRFNSIYNLIEKENHNIKPLLTEINNLIEKYCKLSSLKKIEIILNTNIDLIDNNELQILVLELNSSIISQLRYDIDRNDYKINKIFACVVPEKREIKLGETYKAVVMLVGVDSTSLPEITYENKSKKIKVKNSIIEIKGEKRGRFETKGEMRLKSESGVIHFYPFKFEIEVK
jgi:hypothetical protein